MNAESIKDLLNRRPFEPVMIRLSSGEQYDIRHPELAIVGKARMVIAYPETDRFILVTLLHITSVETLQAA